MNGKTTTRGVSEREQKMRNPRNSAAVGKKSALVITIGAAPTMKKAQVNNSKALKIKK